MSEGMFGMMHGNGINEEMFLLHREHRRSKME